MEYVSINVSTIFRPVMYSYLSQVFFFSRQFRLVACLVFIYSARLEDILHVRYIVEMWCYYIKPSMMEMQ